MSLTFRTTACLVQRGFEGDCGLEGNACWASLHPRVDRSQATPKEVERHPFPLKSSLGMMTWHWPHLKNEKFLPLVSCQVTYDSVPGLPTVLLRWLPQVMHCFLEPSIPLVPRVHMAWFPINARVFPTPSGERQAILGQDNCTILASASCTWLPPDAYTSSGPSPLGAANHFPHPGGSQEAGWAPAVRAGFARMLQVKLALSISASAVRT